MSLLRKMLKAAPLRLWALMGVGPVLTIATVLMVGIVWKGEMIATPADLAGKRLDYLGWTLLALVALIGVIVVTLAMVKVNVRGPGGTGLEVDAKEEGPHA